jgi:hypothetical protein
MEPASQEPLTCLSCLSSDAGALEIVCRERGCRFPSCRPCLDAFRSRCFVCRSRLETAPRIAAELPTGYLLDDLTESVVRALMNSASLAGALHILFVKLHARAPLLRNLVCFISSIGLAVAVGVDCSGAAPFNTSLYSLYLQFWTLMLFYLILYAPVLHAALAAHCHSSPESVRTVWSVVCAALARANAVDSFYFAAAWEGVTGLLEISVVMNALGASFICWSESSPEQRYSAEILTQVSRAVALSAIYFATPRRVLFTHNAYRRDLGAFIVGDPDHW